MSDLIATNFSKQANYYEQVARIQGLAAQRLISRLSHANGIASYQNILEIGCGTGLLSNCLIELFPQQQIHFLDPAPGMLALCKKKLLSRMESSPEFARSPLFIESTIENYLVNKPSTLKYSLIISSFALHWLSDLPSVLCQLLNRLESNGKLIFAFPVYGSFPEWKDICHELNIPFTGNSLPSTSLIESTLESYKGSTELEEYTCQLDFKNAMHFFQEMKILGAATKTDQSKPIKHLTVGAFRSLIKSWNNKKAISCTYRILEGTITNC